MNVTTLPKPPRVGLVSLGCPKALVDSERIMTKLRADGYDMSPDYAGADVVLVNTCGFLDSAKEESLEAIGEAIAENGRVVVTGCMGKEADVIRNRFPQVLAVTGPQQYEDFRGLQPPLRLLHHPAPARRPRQPPPRRDPARGREARRRGHQGAAGHQPGHVGLLRRHPPPAAPVEGRGRPR